MSFPTDTESGTMRNMTKLTQLFVKARYRSLVGDSNAANKVLYMAQRASGQTAALVEYYDENKNILFSIDASGNIIKSGVTQVVNIKKRIALTAGQITTLHSAPVSLIAAPGAGIAINLESLVFEFTYGTTQFTNGGAVTACYHGATGTNLLSGAIAQATVQAAANAYISAGARAAALALSANTGVDLVAAGADFAGGGDSTAIVVVEYDLITLG